MTKEQQDRLYNEELDTIVHLPDHNETMRNIIRIYGLRKLRLGRKVTGQKLNLKLAEWQPKYKTTAYRILFEGELELNITPFFFRQLKKREKLPVETFNYWG